jgi:hypothetical protein
MWDPASKRRRAVAAALIAAHTPDGLSTYGQIKSRRARRTYWPAQPVRLTHGACPIGFDFAWLWKAIQRSRIRWVQIWVTREADRRVLRQLKRQRRRRRVSFHRLMRRRRGLGGRV